MNWNAKIVSHRGEKRIAVFFEKNIDLIARIKKVEGSQWSQSKGFFHFGKGFLFAKKSKN